MTSLWALMTGCRILFGELEDMDLSEKAMAEIRLGIVKSIARGLLRDNIPFVMDYNPYLHCNERYDLDI